MFIDLIKRYFRSAFVIGLFRAKQSTPIRGAFFLLPLFVLLDREMSILGFGGGRRGQNKEAGRLSAWLLHSSRDDCGQDLESGVRGTLTGWSQNFGETGVPRVTLALSP